MSYRKTITAQIFSILCSLEYMVYIVHYELGNPLMVYEAVKLIPSSDSLLEQEQSSMSLVV